MRLKDKMKMGDMIVSNILFAHRIVTSYFRRIYNIHRGFRWGTLRHQYSLWCIQGVCGVVFQFLKQAACWLFQIVAQQMELCQMFGVWLQGSDQEINTLHAEATAPQSGEKTELFLYTLDRCNVIWIHLRLDCKAKLLQLHTAMHGHWNSLL